VPFYVFLNDTLESGIDGILPLLRVDENGDVSLPFVCGTALFKDSVMVGSITDFETKYLLIAKEKLSNAVYSAGSHSFLINSGKSNMKYLDGKIVFDIKIELSLIEGPKKSNKELEEIVRTDIEQGMKKLTDKLKSLGCDPIGMGRCIKRSNPAYWADIYPDRWAQIYSSLPIETNVKVSMVPSPKLAGKDN
jgi:hypothetical protein